MPSQSLMMRMLGDDTFRRLRPCVQLEIPQVYIHGKVPGSRFLPEITIRISKNEEFKKPVAYDEHYPGKVPVEIVIMPSDPSEQRRAYDALGAAELPPPYKIDENADAYRISNSMAVSGLLSTTSDALSSATDDASSNELDVSPSSTFENALSVNPDDAVEMIPGAPDHVVETASAARGATEMVSGNLCPDYDITFFAPCHAFTPGFKAIRAAKIVSARPRAAKRVSKAARAAKAVSVDSGHGIETIEKRFGATCRGTTGNSRRKASRKIPLPGGRGGPKPPLSALYYSQPVPPAPPPSPNDPSPPSPGETVFMGLPPSPNDPSLNSFDGTVFMGSGWRHPFGQGGCYNCRLSSEICDEKKLGCKKCEWSRTMCRGYPYAELPPASSEGVMFYCT